MDKWTTRSISVTGTDSHNYTYSMGGVSLYIMEPDLASLEYAKKLIKQYH